MPNAPRNLPAFYEEPTNPLASMFTTPVSDRVARLVEASRVAAAAYEQSSKERLEETRDEALRLHAHVAYLEEVLTSVGF